MANRCLLHRSKLNSLKLWLGKEVLPTKGQWEVLRWKNKSNQPMKIIFDNNNSSEHLSCNSAAVNDVLSFIKYDHSISRNL